MSQCICLAIIVCTQICINLSTAWTDQFSALWIYAKVHSIEPPRRIVLTPSGREFTQQPGQTILESGLAAGIPLPYRCSNGTCGECKARVIKGDVAKSRFHDFVLTESDRLRHSILMCSHCATSDSIIEVAEATSVEDIPQQSLQAKICQQNQIGDILQLTLKFTRGNALRFLPGQYVQLKLPCRTEITLPISSCPCESTTIELHLLTHNTDQGKSENIPGNDVNEYEFAEKILNGPGRRKVEVNGPIGGVSLSTPPANPQLFLAEGIQFRVLQGLIEQLFNLETESEIALLWVSTEHTDHYRSNLCRSWADALDNFTYIPTDSVQALSKAAITAFLTRFKNATIYHCGADTSILSALSDMELPVEQAVNLALG